MRQIFYTLLIAITCLVSLITTVDVSAMYDPGTGRFMQRDPLGYPDGMNSYAAYHVMWGEVDPTGLGSAPAAPAALAAGGYSAAEIVALTGISAEKAAALVAAVVAAKAYDDAIDAARRRCPRNDRNDPCKVLQLAIDAAQSAIDGLSNQKQLHQQKLRDYTKNPWAHDNKGILQQNRNNPDRIRNIIDGRKNNLRHQIDTFSKDIKQEKKILDKLKKEYKNKCSGGYGEPLIIVLFLGLAVTSLLRKNVISSGLSQ